MGVAGLGIEQDLANEVHGMLHFEGVSLFFPLYRQGGADHLRGGRDVEQKGFSLGRRNQDRGFCQELLDLASASWASGVHSKRSAFFRIR